MSSIVDGFCGPVLLVVVKRMLLRRNDFIKQTLNVAICKVEPLEAIKRTKAKFLSYRGSTS